MYTFFHNNRHRLLTAVAQVTIEMVPELALLKIFDFYVHGENIEAWHTLVHVCQLWRIIVFRSPSRLDLRLLYTPSTPVKKMLDIWPQFPIVIGSDDHGRDRSWLMGRTNNLIAALRLEHNDRICELDLHNMTREQLGKLFPALQKPFPALTGVKILHRSEIPWHLPDSFLAGSTPPHLQTLILGQIQFPGLPRLLLSATYLVCLELMGLSELGCMSPDAMASCLSMLVRLERLKIEFSVFSFSYQSSQHPPQQTRALLPVLSQLQYLGIAEYLEDLVARIDAPLLEKLILAFTHATFDAFQLTHFIDRATKFRALDEARLVFSGWGNSVTFPQIIDGRLELDISYGVSDGRLSSLTQACVSSLLRCFIPAVEHLYIQNRSSLPRCIITAPVQVDLYTQNIFKQLQQVAWKGHSENSQWLELLQPFTTVQDLYISREFVSKIAPALQELVEERVTEVLPALQTLHFEEPLSSGRDKEAIEGFVSARRLAGYPIDVSLWEDEDKPESFPNKN